VEVDVMALEDVPIDTLLRQVATGDEPARQQLLTRHRQRLRQMIAARIDPRLARRLDPSDVIQEVLVLAWQRLPEYLQMHPLPFYPWLRQIAWERLMKLHRQHIKAQKRSLTREQDDELVLSNASVVTLANRLMARESSPSNRAVRDEQRRRVGEALDRLAASDRELLVMRYLEQLSTHEIAAILQISDVAVRTRHVRAIERLRGLLEPQLEDDDR
jgi:RNA polymerase sigma-70 factor (ECF subfamily)